MEKSPQLSLRGKRLSAGNRNAYIARWVASFYWNFQVDTFQQQQVQTLADGWVGFPTWYTTTALNNPRKGLQMMAVNTVTHTIKGHSTIARPANGTQAASTQEPCCPIKSRISLFHPLSSINGLFASATKLIITMSTIIPNSPTITDPGISANLPTASQPVTWRK
jgi:hypothetical protein